MRAVFAPLAVVILSLLTGTTCAASAYPCHDNKGGMGKGVTCTVVKLPNNLCTSCPLRPPNSKGQFIKCDDTYDTSAPSCLSAMKQYVADNPCDPMRADAVAKLEANPDDKAARQIVDYFLYSVCEQCCDCVPMGANKDFFSQYAKAHSASSPTLYDPARGNCPAHAYYDVCKILPKVKAFTRGSVGNLESMPAACGLLNEWFASPARKNWQDEPASNITPELRKFLNNMLEAGQCASKNIWDQCYDLESKQRHLGVPEDAPDIPQEEEEPDAAPAPPPTSAPTDSAKDPENGKSDEPNSQTPDEEGSDTTDTKSPASGDTDEPSTDTPTKGSDDPNSGDDTGSSTPSTDENPSSDNDGEGSKAPASATTKPTASPPGATTEPSSSSLPTATESDTTTESNNAESTIEPKPVGRACFPGDAQVQLEDGTTIAMDMLSIGDVVRVDESRFEPVYMFSHTDENVRQMHVRIELEDGRSVHMTYGHMLQVNGRLAFARHIVPGDVVLTTSGFGIVRRTVGVVKTGLYNPHTASGTIVVNDVICSTFTDAVHDAAANALLAPLRMLFRAGFDNVITVGTKAIL